LTKLTNCLITEEASESYSSRSPEPNFPTPNFPNLKTDASVNANSILRDAISQHSSLEKASFHTPGHKGRPRKTNVDLTTDVTELPGLDDLSHPTGVLANLNHTASAIWNTRSSLISVNGASAGIVAAIMSVSTRGKKLVVPRNAHKSVITGLVLSGLEPVWYTPEWNASWGVFDHIAPSTLASLLEQNAAKGAGSLGDAENPVDAADANDASDANDGSSIAAVIVVSPTYAGAYSDMKTIGAICKRAGVALIVDEAHGAHRFDLRPHSLTSRKTAPVERHLHSGMEAGADIVVHSLHKTLGAMTQTGLVHLPHGSKITEGNLSHHLNMLQSTSPSYTLMLSIEDALGELVGGELEKLGGDACRESAGDTAVQRINRLARNLSLQLAGSEFQIYDTAYGTDTWHILMRHNTKNSTELFDYLLSRGIYPECELGAGVLLMLGVGTNEDDITFLLEALNDFKTQTILEAVNDFKALNDFEAANQFERLNKADAQASSVSILAQPPSVDQVMTPRTASMALSEQVAIADAENLIASECIAPCPPGIPICVPGQRLTKEVLNQIPKDHVRIVQKSSAH
jgi:arginine decarboxylase